MGVGSWRAKWWKVEKLGGDERLSDWGLRYLFRAGCARWWKRREECEMWTEGWFAVVWKIAVFDSELIKWKKKIKTSWKFQKKSAKNWAIYVLKNAMSGSSNTAASSKASTNDTITKCSLYCGTNTSTHTAHLTKSTFSSGVRKTARPSAVLTSSKLLKVIRSRASLTFANISSTS